MAIIGTAQVEVRADVRKLGKDITDSFDGLEKQADQIARNLGESISDSLKRSLDGLTIDVRLSTAIIDDIAAVEEELKNLSDETVKIALDDSDMQKLDQYKDTTINVDVDVDTKQIDDLAAKKIKVGIDENSMRSVRTQVDKVKKILSQPIDVPVEPDTEMLGRNLTTEMNKTLSSVAAIAGKHKIDIGINMDSDEALAKLEEVREAVLQDLELGITLDDGDLEEVNSAIDSMRAYHEADSIDLEIDVKIAKAMAELEFLARKRFVEIVPRVSMAASAAAAGVLAGFTGFNIMREHTEDFIRSLTELDKQLPKIAAQLAALSAVIPVAGFGGGFATMLIGDLASLSGLLVPLTGLFSGLTAAMTIYTVATNYMADLMPGLNNLFNELGLTIASGFWDEAREPMMELAGTTLPYLVDEMSGLTAATGRFYGGLLSTISAVINTDRGMGNLNQIFDNTSSMLDNMQRGIRPLIQGFLTIARVGSTYLPALGTYFSDIAEEFDKWVQTNDENGNLLEWADKGIVTLKELGSIVVSTVGIFYSLYKIAENIGFPGLTELADGLESVNAALKTEGVITTLTEMGVAVRVAFENIANSMAWIGPLISEHTGGITDTIYTMGEIVGGILDGIGDMFTNTNLVESFFGLFDSMNTAVQAFRPAFESIGTIMAVTFDFLGSALENITPILTQFFENLANDAELIKPSFMGMLDVIGEWGPQVMEVVGEVTNGVAKFIGDLNPVLVLAGLAFAALSPIILSVGLAIGGLISWIGSVVGGLATLSGALGGPTTAAGLLTKVMDTLKNIFPKLSGALRVLGGPIGIIIALFISAFASSEDLRKAVGDLLVNAFKTVAAAIEPLIGPIGSLLGAIGEISAEIGAVLAPAFTSVLNVLNALFPVVQLVAKVIGEVLGASITTFVGIIKGAWALVSGILKGVVTQISAIFNGIATIIEGVIQTITSLFTGDMAGAVEGLKTIFSGVVEIVTGTMEGMVEVISGIITGIVEAVKEIGTGIMEGIRGMLEGFGLSDAGLAIIDSLIEGFQNGLQKVIDWLTDLTQAIIDSKGPPEKDATLLTAAGESIMQSLIQGFMNVFNEIISFLQNLTQQIVDTVLGVINGVVNVFTTGWSVLTTIVQNVWNGIVTVITTVFTFITTAVQNGINFVVNVFTTGWQILTTIVQTVWMGIKLVIDTVWIGIQNVIQIGIDFVTNLFTIGWTTLTVIVQTVWNGIWNIIQTVMTTIQLTIQTIMTSIQNVISIAWNAITTVVSTVWNTIKVLISLALAAVKALISGNFEQFKAIISTAWNLIKNTTSSVWNTIKSAIQSILNVIRSTIANVFNAIRSTISNVMNTIRSVISSVWNTIKSAISAVINAIRSTVTNGFNTIRSTVSNVMNTIRSVTSSVWNAIRSVISSVISSVRSTISSGMNTARSAVTNAWNTVRSMTTSAWNSVVSTVTSKVSAVIGKVRSIPGQVRSALGNASSILVNAGRNIIQGLINGVTDKIGALKNKFSSVTNMIPDWKGPPDTDATLLTNAGELIMQGLIDGIESKFGAVRGSLQGFTSSLSDNVNTQIGADIGVSPNMSSSALSDSVRGLSYRSRSESVVQSNGTPEGSLTLQFFQPMANPEEIITVVKREFGRGV